VGSLVAHFYSDRSPSAGPAERKQRDAWLDNAKMHSSLSKCHA